MFDAIMRLASANANKQMEALSDVSVNVANMNTTGYKSKRFEQYITLDNRLDGIHKVDTVAGDRILTHREMDVFIDGPGYIPVTQPDGAVAYTRDGGFTLNSQGYLVTHRGDLVGDGIRLPSDYKKLHILDNGEVQVKTASQSERYETIGKIKLVRFRNAEELKSVGGNKLLPTEESGEPVIDTQSQLRQNSLERANVDVHEQVETVLKLNASYISNLRIIKFADDLYRQAVQLRQ
jgi:flagellar basal-body rod protein FlgG